MTVLFVLLFLWWPDQALAAAGTGHKTMDFGDWSLWGIMSQGYVWTSNHSFFGSRDDPGGYREASMGSQYRLMDNLTMNMQGEYRDAGESDNEGLRLSQMFMEGHMRPWKDWFVGAAMGRVEIPFGLYNRTRDRVDTRPSIMLPQSIYLDGLGIRNLSLTGDGGVMYGAKKLTPKSRVEARVSLTDPVGIVRGLEDALLFSGWADYVWDDALRLRFTMFASKDGDTQVTFPVFSTQYRYQKWTATAEYGVGSFKTPSLPKPIESDGVYGQIEYSVTPDLNLFGRYDWLKFTRFGPRKDGAGIGVGFSLDITENIILNGEYYRVDGTAWLSPAENPGLGITEPASDFDMVMFMGSVRF